MTSVPRAERPSAAVRFVLTVALILPLAVAGWLLLKSGFRSDTHGLFLSRVLFAVDRGQLELLGFEYPPLPFLALLPWPSQTWALILGSLALGALSWMVLGLCHERRSILPFILLTALFWSPFGLHLITTDFNEAVGLAALYAGWKQYRQWWLTRRTIYGLYTGLWLGIAFYTSPLGLALALVAGAVLPLLLPRLRIPPFASQLSLLVFPGIAASLTWAWLAWIFTHQVALPFTPWEPDSPGLGKALLWSSPYLAISLIALTRPKATTAGLLLPPLLFWGATLIGWNYSLAFAVAFLTLIAITAIPLDLGRAARAGLVCVAVLQSAAAWMLLPEPRLSDSDISARAVATALAKASPRSILLDDRRAEKLLKWAPSLSPYLTTRDMTFDIALTEPGAVVRYVLIVHDSIGATLDADVRPPKGFVIDWSWEGYTLYRRRDAPGLPVFYPAIPEVIAP